jgi:hypothetical protein
MPRYRFFQNNFLNGEISPEYAARIETEQYQTGVETLENMLPLTSGGVTRRKGSEFLFSSVDGEQVTSGSRIIPFIFNEQEKYLFVFRPDNDLALVYNARSGNSFTLNLSSTADGLEPCYGDSSGSQLSANQLKEIQYAQTGDILVITHPEFRPFYIARTAEDTFISYVYNWDVILAKETSKGNTNFDRTTDAFAWEGLNTTDVVLTTTNTTGSITISSANAIFDRGQLGSTVYFVDSGVVGYATITGFSTPNAVVADVKQTLPAAATGGLLTWAFEAWSSTNGFPRSVTFHEQRAVFGGNNKFPDTIWGSQTGNLFNLTNTTSQILGTSTIVNTDPFIFALASTEVNQINWIESGSRLNIGTLGREYTASGTSGVLGPLDVTIQPQTSHGCAHVQPVRFENSLVYVQKARQKIRDFTFFRDENSFRSLDLTYFSEHAARRSLRDDTVNLFDSGFVRIVSQETQGIIWMLDDNYSLIGMTRRKTTNNLAFHFHEFGGSDVLVESIASLPSKDVRGEDLYLIISRKINGSVVNHLEKISRPFFQETVDPDVSLVDNLPVYTDSSKFIEMFATSDVHFRVSYTSNADAEITSGTATPTAGGTPVVTGGFAELGQNDSYTYSIVGTNALAKTGAMRLKFKANSNWLAAGFTRDLVKLTNNSTSEQVRLRYSTATNQIEITITTSTGDTVLSTNTPKFSFIAGQVYEIEINWDVDADGDSVRIFVDGVQLGITLRKQGFDMDGSAAFDRVEVTGTAGASDQIDIDEITVFETNIHKSSYTTQDFQLQSTTVPGFSHLESETVQVVADGIYVGEKTVASGNITIPRVARRVIAGLKYVPVIETMPIEVGSTIGTGATAIQKIDRATVRFDKTIGAKVGSEASDVDEIIFRPTGHPMNTALPLFTGDKIVNFPGGPERRAQVYITQDQPFPLTVLGMMLRGIVYD